MKIVSCDFDNPLHTQAVVRLMNAYMSDTMGGELPLLTPKKAFQLIEGLRKHPSKLVLLAMDGKTFVGLTNCFINFGTFACKPFINIHDLIVLPAYRGKGIGKLFMQTIEQHALATGCGKITLEVRKDNTLAQKLYKQMGYSDCDPPMHFWVRHLP